MKVLSSQLLISTVCVAALLGGCSSSSNTSDDGLQDDPTDTVTGTGTDTGLQDDPTDTDTDTDTDTGTDTDTENPPTSGLDMLVPNVAAGSDLERLITGIKRQVSMTLLDLNQRISQGEKLTDQQETCLGAFDPAVGEQLLAINCEQALATGDVSVYVEEAAFYDTKDCQASIFNGNTDNCQLQSTGISLPDLFRVPDGERRPVLAYAGSNLSYALTDTMLHIESSELALAGVFKCDIDLASGSSSTPLVGTSCASIITSTADHLDDVVPQ